MGWRRWWCRSASQQRVQGRQLPTRWRWWRRGRIGEPELGMDERRPRRLWQQLRDRRRRERRFRQLRYRDGRDGRVRNDLNLRRHGRRRRRRVRRCNRRNRRPRRRGRRWRWWRWWRDIDWWCWRRWRRWCLLRLDTLLMEENVQKRYAIIEEATGICVNVVMWDGNEATWRPPDGCRAVQDASIEMGHMVENDGGQNVE